MSFNVSLRVNEPAGRFISQHQGLSEGEVVKHYRDHADELSLRGMCRVASIADNDSLQKGETVSGLLLEVEYVSAPTLEAEMQENREDIERGRAMLEGGEAVRYDELREGDEIVGVGKVDYVHVHNGGVMVNVGIEGIGTKRYRAELKVTIKPREPKPLDMDAHYTVEGYKGIAFYLRGYVEEDDADTEWTGIKAVNRDQVRAVMVGDDREHIVDVSDLTVIGEDDYCHECGQIGCSHDGR